MLKMYGLFRLVFVGLQYIASTIKNSGYNFHIVQNLISCNSEPTRSIWSAFLLQMIILNTMLKCTPNVKIY